VLAVLMRPHVLSCRLSWALNLVTQHGGRKGAYVMIVAVHNVCVDCCHCTLKQAYGNMLNNVMITNSL
jgi:hypothetical protein